MKDCVDRGELTVEHMSTYQMWADINTKPLQGKGFRVMRSQLMNITENYDDKEERHSTPTSLLPSGDSTAQDERPITINKAQPGSSYCKSVLDRTVVSGGTSAELIDVGSCKTPRVTHSQKFRQLLRRVRQAREYSPARIVAVE